MLLFAHVSNIVRKIQFVLGKDGDWPFWKIVVRTVAVAKLNNSLPMSGVQPRTDSSKGYLLVHFGKLLWANALITIWSLSWKNAKRKRHKDMVLRKDWITGCLCQPTFIPVNNLGKNLVRINRQNPCWCPHLLVQGRLTESMQFCAIFIVAVTLCIGVFCSYRSESVCERNQIENRLAIEPNH